MTTTQDNMPQVKRFWRDVAHEFDATCTGKKSPVDVGVRFWNCCQGRSSWLQVIPSITHGGQE